MDNSVLKKIKCSSIRSIMNILIDSDKITRAELADATSLSIMTVGKTADALLRLGIIEEVKELSESVGRRAGKLSFSSSVTITVFDLSEYDFKLKITDIRGKTLLSRTHKYDREASYSDNLTEFIASSFEDVMNGLPIGVAILLPTSPSAAVSSKIPQTEKSDPVKIAESFFPALSIVSADRNILSAEYSISSIPAEERGSVMYFGISRENISSTLFFSGIPCQRADGNSYGIETTLRGNTELSDLVSASNDSTTLASVITPIIYYTSKLVSPSAVVIGLSREDMDLSRLSEKISSSLSSDFLLSDREKPKLHISAADEENEITALITKLREKWIEDFVNEKYTT